MPEPVTLVITGRSLHQSAYMFRGRGRMRNGKWGPVPKSAPPTLARRRAAQASSRVPSSKSMRVMSAHSAAARPPGQPSPQPLSIHDVYKMAESTRQHMSQVSRQLVLTRTQKLVRNDSGMSRPVSGLTPAAISRGAWREVHPLDPTVRDCVEDEARYDVSTPRTHDTALKPRSASASQLHNTGAASGPGSRHNSRLGSALTVSSTALGSDFGCVSPRPVDSEARKLSVSRQCCEVMGPGVCRDCQKLRARMKDRERMEADFPRLRISEKNVTTSAVIMRVLPDMTQAEIQDKIARGEIDRSGLHFPPRRLRGQGDESDDDTDYEFKLKCNGIPGQQDDSNDEDDDFVSSKKVTPKSDRNSKPTGRSGSDQRPDTAKSTNSLVLLTKLKLKLAGEASTPLFFMNLKHQNSKIFQGRVDKYLKTSNTTEEEEENGEEEEEGVTRLRDRRVLSVANNPACVQAFVGPRKVKPPEEPSYKVYFDPPLLAKHRQESTPSFFAGSDNPYHLPERLPDVIEFADGQTSLTDPTALRSESSMSFVSAVSEEGMGDGASHRTEGLKVVQE